MRHVEEYTEGSVYQTKDGRWRAAIIVGYDGRGVMKRRTVSGKTKAIVIARRRELLDELRGRSLAPSQMTMETWATRWIDEIAPGEVRPTTMRTYRSAVKNHIIPTLGQYRVQEIGPEEVRELQDTVRGKGLSGRTVQIVNSLLSVILKAAMWEGIIDHNPVERVRRPRANSKPRGALTVDQAHAVITHDHPLRSMFATALLMGPRKGELLGLEWPRIDLDVGTVDLSWQLQWIRWRHGQGCACAPGMRPRECEGREHDIPDGFEMRACYGARVFTRPKTAGSVRLLPIPTPLVPILEEHRAVGVRATSGLVWHHGGRPLREPVVAEAWRDVLTAVGAPLVDLHSARHTTASLLLDAGVSMEVIRQILGHTDVVTTRGYAHMDLSTARRAMGDLSRYLGLG